MKKILFKAKDGGIVERLTEREPYWLGEEYWVDARFPEKEEIDEVYEKLKYYENLEEDGKILKLPCKPGDTVYVISKYTKYDTQIIGATVTLMKIKDDGKTVSFSCRGKWKNGNPYIGNFVNKSIGKTVFLTEHEAQAALEEMKYE